MKKILFPLLLLILLTGCISSERMVRNSPLGRAKKIEVRFDSDTVNLWPLFYRDPAGMNVLWPFYDQDANGFAIRPFYVNEGNEHSFLWPLSGWNNREGWFLTGFWNRDRESYGFIPIYVQTKRALWVCSFLKRFGAEHWYEQMGLLPLGYYSSPEAWFAGPAWRVDSHHGVFPLYWYSKGNWSVVPLMDWHTDFKRVLLGWKGKESAGFFPLLLLSDEFNYAGPVWWKEGAGGFFPLVWLSKDFNLAGPVWWSKGGGGVFPLASFSGKFNHVGPVWWNQKGGGFFPLVDLTEKAGNVLLYWWDDDDGIKGIFPLGFHRSNKHGNYLNLLGPVAGYDDRQDNYANHFLYPLWRYRSDRSHGEWRRRWMVWPLVSWNGGSDGGFLFSPLLEVIDRPASPQEREQAIPNSGFTPFGSSFSYGQGQPSRIMESRKSYLLCGLGFHESGTARVWKPGTDSNRLTMLGGNVSAWRWSDEKWRQESRERIAGLMKELNLSDPVPETQEEADALLRKLAAEYTVETAYSEHRTLGGLGSWYERFGDEHWGQFLFCLIMTRKYEDKSDFRILGYLYREKHDGDASEYLIPPFINIKSSPERNSWSFLYRLLHYENNDGKKSGSVFFIPWGEK